MIGYFKNFQRTLYSLDKNDLDIKEVTNILHRSTFLKEISEKTAVFYEYQMKEDDTPEIIADKLYGDANRHWIILLFNNIMNPFYDLPLKSDALDEYIMKKYDQTITQAQSTIHHYQLDVIRTITKNGTYISQNTDTYTVNGNTVNFQTGQIGTRTVPGTPDTYLESTIGTVLLPDGSICTVVERITSVSNYTNEVNENEKRRTIKLIDKAYISRIEEEFTKLMQNG